MLNKSLKSSAYLTNKALWYVEAVTNSNNGSSVVIETNQNSDISNLVIFKPVAISNGLLTSKQYPFKNSSRKAKGSLQSFSHPPKP
jgi:hypothetical protein